MLLLSGLGLVHARRTSPATEILSGHRRRTRPGHLPGPRQRPAARRHPSRLATPAGTPRQADSPSSQTRGLAGNTGQAVVVMHTRARPPATSGPAAGTAGHDPPGRANDVPLARRLTSQPKTAW